MDLELNDEHLELRRVSRDFLDAYSPPGLARTYLDGHGDAAHIWSSMAELGWCGVGFEDDDPFGTPGLAILAAELGSHATPQLVVDTVIVARALRAIGESTADAWGEQLATGRWVSLALLEDTAGWELGIAAQGTEATLDGDRFLLGGAKRSVHHAASCESFAVAATTDDGPALLLVPRDSAGVEIDPSPGVDPATAEATVRFHDTPVAKDSVFTGAAATAAWSRILDVGAIAAAAEAVGAAGAAMDLAVAYSLERSQFGRPIGGFQALQHLLADLHVQRETAWSAVLYAAAAIDADLTGVQETVSIAKAHASRAARIVAEGALQVFGGVGFTREHDLHLFYRRVLSAEQRFGNSAFHEERLASQLCG